MAALVQLVLCVSTSFCSALFACCFKKGNISMVCVWSRFPPLCLRCFLLVCYSAFFFPFSCGLPPVANIVAQGPVGTPMPSPRVPPQFMHPLRRSPPFMGIPEPLLLCVCLFLVCIGVFGHVSMLLGRAHVCLPMWMVCKCVC